MRGAVHRRVFEESGVTNARWSWDDFQVISDIDTEDTVLSYDDVNEEQYALGGNAPDLPSGESCSSCQKIFGQDLRDCQDGNEEHCPRAPTTTIPGLGEVSGANPSTGTGSYYWLDHLGSTRGLFNASFTRVATYEYTPYGEMYLEDEDGASTNRRYTGHTYDAFTGHYYAPYRYYAPTIARWLKRDPLGMVDGPNLYGYVRGNPLARTDPMELGLVSAHTCEVTRGNCQAHSRQIWARMVQDAWQEFRIDELYITVLCVGLSGAITPVGGGLCHLTLSGLSATELAERLVTSAEIFRMNMFYCEMVYIRCLSMVGCVSH